jgi:hypothetical protein
MGDYPNLREFYQKRLILIGENDRVSLKKESPPDATSERSTHWLIAMEGTEKRPDVFHWKVFVYSTEKNGAIPFDSPFYSSRHFASIHDAISFCNELGLKASLDQMSTLQ